MITTFINGRIWTGTDVFIQSGYVEISGAKISGVGRGFPDSTGHGRVVDLHGKTLMPGLIDLHVHVCLDGSSRALTQFLEESLETTTLRAARALQEHVRQGVTAVRDVACPWPVATALKQMQGTHVLQGARFWTSGPAITTPGGHGHYFGLQTTGEAEIVAAVEQLAAADVDLIKVMGSGGSLTVGTNTRAAQFSPRELRSLVAAAHANGRKVAIHAHADDAIYQAIEAEVDTVEHGSYATRDTIDVLAGTQIVLVPTLAPANWVVGSLSPAQQPSVTERVNMRRQATKWAIEAGVAVATGTDAGIPHMPHGHVADEVMCLVELGMAPDQALRAATSVAAETLDVADQIGTIEIGKLADLIVVAGDPLADLTALKRVDMVFLNGTQWLS